MTPGSFFTFLAWGLFCFFPSAMGLAWELHWRRLERGLSAARQLPWYLTEERDGRKYGASERVLGPRRDYGWETADEGGTYH